MSTFEAFGMTFPLEILLWLGLSVLVACAVLAAVLGATIGERQTKESFVRALPERTGEPDVDAHFDSVNEMLNGSQTAAMDPIVARIVDKVHEVIAAAEAVELEECEQEFLADPMHFGRPVQ